jgi:hypothetical protein
VSAVDAVIPCRGTDIESDLAIVAAMQTSCVLPRSKNSLELNIYPVQQENDQASGDIHLLSHPAGRPINSGPYWGPIRKMRTNE